MLNDVGLLETLLAHDWYLDTGALRYFSHWLTPKIEPRRFSARFFVAQVPAAQTAGHDAVETTDGQWLTPVSALCAYRDKKIQLPPPQIRTLDELSRLTTVEDILASAPHRPTEVHAPHFIHNDPPHLVLEGDPLHPTASGPTRRRFTLTGGIWVQDFGNR